MITNAGGQYDEFRLAYEELFSSLSHQEPLDEYNHAIRLLILGLLHNTTKFIIEYSPKTIDQDVFASRQQHYAGAFREILSILSADETNSLKVTGNLESSPQIHDFEILGVAADDLRQHLMDWRSALGNTDHDIRLAGVLGQFEEQFFSRFEDIPPVTPESYMVVPSSRLAHQVRLALATRAFSLPGNGLWPQADLLNKRDVRAMAMLMPEIAQKKLTLHFEQEKLWQEKMTVLMGRMNDLTADVYDVMCSTYLKQANADEVADLTADEILLRRGLAKHKGGNGRRGGFTIRQRQAVDRQLEIMSNLYLSSHTMKNNKKRSWDGEQKFLRWHKCQDLFCTGKYQTKQYALLSERVLQYNPYHKKWEKRLTRYLSWRWRVQKTRDGCIEPVAVQILLSKAIGAVMNPTDPLKTRKRLENALERLRADSVIMSWKYVNAPDWLTGRKGWQKTWLTQKLVIEPPDLILKQYEKIRGKIVAPQAEKILRAKPSSDA